MFLLVATLDALVLAAATKIRGIAVLETSPLPNSQNKKAGASKID